MNQDKTYFNCENLLLEGEVSNVDSNVGVAVIICHPHPLFGGNMYNNVVDALFHHASQKGFLALRFNFRGVGKSQGRYGGGKAEVKDVNAAVNHLRNLAPNLRKIAIIGYSFGAWVSTMAAVENVHLNTMIVISPPLSLFDFSHLKNSKKQKYFILGSLDEFAPLNSFIDFYNELYPPKNYKVIPNADHFYLGYELEVAKAAMTFLKIPP